MIAPVLYLDKCPGMKKRPVKEQGIPVAAMHHIHPVFSVLRTTFLKGRRAGAGWQLAGIMQKNVVGNYRVKLL